MSIIRSALQAAEQSDIQANLVSNEDAWLDIVEADAMLVTIEHQFEEAERATHIAASLEALSMVTGMITEASTTDLAFIDVATSLALAGTDNTAEEALPAMEQYLGATVSNEGIGKIASDVWKAIKKALAGLIKRITMYWGKLTGALPNLVKQAEKLKVDATEAMGKTAGENSVDLKREANALSTGHKAPSNGADIIECLTDFNELLEPILVGLAKLLGKLPTVIAKEMGSIEFTDRVATQAVTRSIGQKAREVFTDKIVTSAVKGKVNDTRFDANKATTTKTVIPGGKALFLTIPSNQEGTDGAGRIVLSVQDETNTKWDAIESAKLAVMTPEQCVTVAELVIATLKLVMDSQDKKMTSEIKANSDKLKDATDKMEKVYKTASKEESFKESEMSPFRTALRGLNMAYLKWATGPQSSLSSTAMAVSRAAITASKRSLAVYK